MDEKKLLNDLVELKIRFPKLYLESTQGVKLIRGELDICDTNGVYWDTFEIAITIPVNYPYGIPILWEATSKIPRKIERHISEQGQCCVDIDHELIYLSERGISLNNFVRDKAYPYFANQLYYEEKKNYANGEYLHFFDGVIQFYEKRLLLTEPETAIKFIELVLQNQIPSRNSKCPCDSNLKLKNCHETSTEILKSLGLERLNLDLIGFKELIKKANIYLNKTE